MFNHVRRVGVVGVGTTSYNGWLEHIEEGMPSEQGDQTFEMNLSKSFPTFCAFRVYRVKVFMNNPQQSAG